MERDGLIDWTRPEFLKLKGYSACKNAEALGDAAPKRIVKLDANENPYGSHPDCYDAIDKIPSLAIYPDAAQTSLKHLAAVHCGCEDDQIVFGAGSSQLIEYLIRLFVDRDEELINLVPSFAMYQFFSNTNCNKVVNVPRDQNFEIDIDGIRKAITPKTKLMFIANPNNPTGNVTPIPLIEEALDLGIPTVVDEAYYEFTGITALPLMKKYPNLMVLRSFSKFAGLAGLRVGYGIFPKDIADRLHAIRDPYNINVAAVAAAKVAIAHYDELMVNVKKVCVERDRLLNMLQEISYLHVYPSKSNYIMCKVLNGKSATYLQTILEEQGILTRCFGGVWLENCIRFSIGLPEEDDILMDALKKLE